MTPSCLERLPNGFRTVVSEVPGRHQVLVALLVRAGSRYESPRESGISHFLEHMLFRGNAAFPDAERISLAFERVGSIPNACTSVEATEFYFVCHPGRIENGLAALAELVRSPTFPAIEKERGIVMDEILYDHNEQGELIHLGALAAGLLWPGHPLGQSVTGTLETVPTLDETALRAHHARHYTPGNMVLALAGDVTPERGFELARRAFGGWPAGVPGPQPEPAGEAPRPPGPRIKMVHESDNQFQIQLSFPAPGYNAPEEIPLGMMARLLDDGPTTRLQAEIREERALAYHVGADYTAYHDMGQFDVATSVRADRLEEMLEALLGCLARFRDEGPTEEELARAKQRHRLEMEFGRDSLDARIERYAWPLLYSTVRESEQELALLEGVTTEEIRRLAHRVIARENLHLVVVGPKKTRTENIVTDAVQRL